MRAFFVLTRMRVLDVLRSRSSAGFFLALPVVLLVLVGLVFANGQPFERRRMILVDEGTPASPAALDAIAASLEGHDGIRVERGTARGPALGRLDSRMTSAVLVRDADGESLRLVVGPRDRLWAMGVRQVLSVPVEIEVHRTPRWGYVHYLFPGLLTFAVLLAGLFGMGHAMVRYRQSQLLKKLATTPLRRSTFVGAQITARALLVLLQMIVLVVVAALLFDLPLSLGAAAWMALVTTLGLLTFMGAGFALACLVRTEDLMVDVISAVNLPLVFLSEIFFPLDDLPAPLRAIGDVLPSTHMVRLLREVTLYGTHEVGALAPSLLNLALWAAGTFAVSLLAFRWHR